LTSSKESVSVWRGSSSHTLRSARGCVWMGVALDAPSLTQYLMRAVPGLVPITKAAGGKGLRPGYKEAKAGIFPQFCRRRNIPKDPDGIRYLTKVSRVPFCTRHRPWSPVYGSQSGLGESEPEEGPGRCGVTEDGGGGGEPGSQGRPRERVGQPSSCLYSANQERTGHFPSPSRGPLSRATHSRTFLFQVLA